MRRVWLIGAAIVAVLVCVCGGALGETVVVSSVEGSELWIFDTEVGRFVAVIDVGCGAHVLAVSGDGRRIVGTAHGTGPRYNRADNRLVVFDVDTGVHGTIDLGDNPHPKGVGFVGDDRVLVTSETHERLIEVDLGSGEIVRTIEHGAGAGHMLVVSGDLRRVYVSCVMEGHVIAIDLESGEVVGVVETGVGAEGICVTGDDRWVWVANSRAGTISVIDAEELEVVETIVCGGFPFRVARSPDGASVWVCDPGGARMLEYDATTMGLIRGYESSGRVTEFAVSTDRGLVYLSTGHGHISARTVPGDEAGGWHNMWVNAHAVAVTPLEYGGERVEIDSGGRVVEAGEGEGG